ncbi:MAG: hypothetical protein HYR96_12475 [Deltaproteobacteria bacterium]|nr:hypothetical protein [Deltaproteobacteria bacterium]MBI3296149.1 hypothetical protein [Deltaproteobacteria bacterium]
MTRWFDDVTLGPSPNGSRVTMVPSLAGAIASIRTADGTELIHSGGHGAAFTLSLHPDNPMAPNTFSECYNPTEEGAGWDDKRDFNGNLLSHFLGGQNHGMSTTQVQEWKYYRSASGNENWFDTFISKTRYAYFWNFKMGFDASGQCWPTAHTKNPLSNFYAVKKVNFGKLKDADGRSLANDWANYLTIDHIIYVQPNEMFHSRMESTEVAYLAMTAPHKNQFTHFCTMTVSDSTQCAEQSEALSWDRMQPVIAGDANWSHAIGTMAEEPWFDNSPPGATVRFLNQRAHVNPDAWATTTIKQNWSATNIGPTGSGTPVALHTRIYYTFGTQSEVTFALDALRSRMKRSVAILAP